VLIPITSIAALAAVILLTLTLAAGGRRTLGRGLIVLPLVVAGLVELFDLLALVEPSYLSTWRTAGLVCEGLMVPCWLIVGMAVRGHLFPFKGSIPTFVLLGFLPFFLFSAFSTSVDQVFFNPDFAQEKILFLSKTGFFYYLSIIFYLTSVLVMLERGYTSRDRGSRWQIKLEIVGLGAIIAAQFFYYSQALLYRSIDFSLLPVRSLALLLGCGMIAYSRLRRGVPKKVRLSREVTYRSVVVLVVGLYLFFLGVVGEGIRYFGVHSQRYVLGVIALFGGVSIILLILSGTYRRRVLVLINKHFFKEKYDYRCHWIDFSCRLAMVDTLERASRSALQFYAETFSVRGGALYLYSADQHQFEPLLAMDHALPVEKLDASSPLVTFLQESGWVFNREDGQAEILRAHPSLLAPNKFCFVVPLYVGDRIEALLFLGDRLDSREKVNYEDYDLMKTLAVHTMAALQNYRLGEQLSSSREMAAIGRVSTFVMHDLKNLVSNLALVVENSRDYLEDPEFQQDMLSTLDGSVERMKGLIQRLQMIGTGPDLHFELVDLRRLAAELLTECSGLNVQLVGESVSALIDPDEIRKVLLNLVLNGSQASPAGGEVLIEVRSDPAPCFIVRDQGCGMSEEFIRDRLFRPFETTKKKGFGVGLYQSKQIVDAHGGKIEVHSVPWEGTEMRVIFKSPKGSSAGMSTENDTQENRECAEREVGRPAVAEV